MSMQSAPLVINQPMQPMQPMAPVVVVGNSSMPTTTTTVVSSVSAPLVMGVDFQTGICDCFSQLDVCCMAWCCPCVTYGQIEQLLKTNGADPNTDFGQCAVCCCASAVGNSLLAFIGCPGVVHAFFICGQRKRYRQRTNMYMDNDCEDAAWSCCCPHCALAQVYLEETRYKTLSRSMAAPPQQVMVAGAPDVTVVQSSTPAVQSIYAMPPQPAYIQPGYSVSQSAYGHPAPQPYYAQPPQPVVSAQPPSYAQPYYTQSPQ